LIASPARHHARIAAESRRQVNTGGITLNEQRQAQPGDAPVGDGATFALDPNDPRTLDNRGGLEAVAGGEPSGHSMAGADPAEGSASGAAMPQVEMTDVGLVDASAADMSLPRDGTAGARVEDEVGNPL
jgi:hypothetical protein